MIKRKELYEIFYGDERIEDELKNELMALNFNS
jgi:hypothetical protein